MKNRNSIYTYSSEKAVRSGSEVTQKVRQRIGISFVKQQKGLAVCVLQAASPPASWSSGIQGNEQPGNLFSLKALCENTLLICQNTIFGIFALKKLPYIDFFIDFCNYIVYTDSTGLLTRR